MCTARSSRRSWYKIDMLSLIPRSTFPINFFVSLFAASWATYAYPDIDYTTEIAPILDKHCVKCHGPKKQKSGYRLDSYHAFMSPGDSEEDPIRSRDPMGSPLMEYLLLPKSDDYAMPPEDEDSPSGDDILKIAHWIYQGAKEGDAKLARLPIEELLSPDTFAALETLRSRGAIIHKRGQNEATLTIDIQNLATSLTPADINHLKNLATYTSELRLARLQANDLAWLETFNALEKLDLSHSAISDAAVPVLNSLSNLKYLNLFGTQLSNHGIKDLRVPASGTLYIGQTKVKPWAIKAARATLPKRNVYGLPNIKEVETITDNALSNSNEFNPVREIAPGKQSSTSGIKHSFIVFGKTTAIFNEYSQATWVGPRGTRDGEVLANGNVLVSTHAIAREYKKGTYEVVWSYKLDKRNSELGTVNRLENGNTLVVERGPIPRILEVDSNGRIVVEVPLQPETVNAHMQTRMARKLPNGNYLVPHLLAFKVKEYTPSGKVVNVLRTDQAQFGGREAKNWPFTAIRLESGNTLVSLTNGNKIAEFAPDGTVAWYSDNSDVDGRFQDPCGAQRLPNGNTIICAYGQNDPSKAKVFEITPEKEVVWEFFHPEIKAHEIQILTRNLAPLSSDMR